MSTRPATIPASPPTGHEAGCLGARLEGEKPRAALERRIERPAQRLALSAALKCSI